MTKTKGETKMNPKIVEYEEKYQRIEQFVDNHDVLKTLTLEKIISCGKWSYAFVISGDYMDFIYRDNVRSRSLNELTHSLSSFAKKVKKAQEVAKPYVNYFSSEYGVSVNLDANEISLVHKETERKYILRIKEEGRSLSRLVKLCPKTDSVLVGRSGELEFLVKLNKYSHDMVDMNDICQDMASEKSRSLVDYLSEF